MSDQGGVHQIASDGFAKGSLYDQHRPAYPPEAVELLLNQLGLTTMTGAKIVDLGAGTGKFTEALATRQEHSEIVAVEPLDSMRDVLASKRLDRVEARRGTATQTGLEDGWADVVIVAQVGAFPHDRELPADALCVGIPLVGKLCRVRDWLFV